MMEVLELVLTMVVASSAFFLSYCLCGTDMHRLLRLTKGIRSSVGTYGYRWSRRRERRPSVRERRSRVLRDMPTFLDVVTLGLSAGLSFDASLELYCKRYDTDLSKTMRGTLQLWRIGVKSRAEALEEMARELDVPAMTRFVATVSEALAFGTPLAETLERQAQVIREEQRAQMEEEVEKVPVKMLIPLGTLIVPAMLLAILGPLLGPALGLA